MGLDMYLISVPKDSKIESYDDYRELINKAQKRGDEFVGNELAYWRKANMVHRWFCNNCKEIEEGILYKVEPEDLYQLIGECANTLIHQSKAPDILPTQQGCFFGNLCYDGWYFDSLLSTIEQCGHALYHTSTVNTNDVTGEDEQVQTNDIYYLASW